MPVMNKSVLPVQKRLQIDLDGQKGNAFVILGTAKSLAKQIGYNDEQTEEILKQMRKADYDHLMHVFLTYFNSYVDFWTSNTELLEKLEQWVKVPIVDDDILEHEG
jgi:hypothetical protein